MLRALKFWGIFLGILSVALLVLGLTVPLVVDNHVNRSSLPDARKQEIRDHAQLVREILSTVAFFFVVASQTVWLVFTNKSSQQQNLLLDGPPEQSHTVARDSHGDA